MGNNARLRLLNEAFTSGLRSYHRVSERNHFQLTALTMPVSTQQCLDMAKWQKQEIIAYNSYTVARDNLITHLRAGS